MKKFPKDTKDVIEKLYASKILKSFPLYGKFWEELIGIRQRKNSGCLLPYGLKFRLSHSKDERKRIREIYEKITMTHYSLFLALAGAHFQRDQMQRILRRSAYKTRYFRYWEAFDVCYIHLGSAFYQAHRLWNLYFRLSPVRGKGKNKSKGKNKRKGKLETYLTDNPTDVRKKRIWKKFKKAEDSVKVLRDNMVHFTRQFNWPIQDGFLIPYNVRKDVSWARQRRVRQKVLSHFRARDDLLAVEKVLNELHGILLPNLLRFFKQEGIQVRK